MLEEVFDRLLVLLPPVTTSLRKYFRFQHFCLISDGLTFNPLPNLLSLTRS